MLRTADRHNGSGRTPISVQWRGRLEVSDSRAHRKERLAANLRKALDEEPSIDVSWDTLSVSAQTVEASVDPADLDRVVADLNARGLRVDEVVDRQVI